ncbi:MAG TPA: hypothetical protein VE967_02205 [Gemmatimonadaceae bacterium]|nr:hypothetical protein [Gemmatimonadaceae bacterium]
MGGTGPHAREVAQYGGSTTHSAEAAMIMVHGRGGKPSDILGILPLINRPRVMCVAPAAANNTWYPFSFISPREQNEPYLSSALSVIEANVLELLELNVPLEKILLLGFSQGACLLSEFVIRHPRKYGGLLALSGGLIGPLGTTWDDVHADLTGMHVFLGCSDVDSHIPKERVIESEAVFTRLGASVTRVLYPGMGHVINPDEIRQVQRVIDDVIAAD